MNKFQIEKLHKDYYKLGIGNSPGYKEKKLIAAINNIDYIQDINRKHNPLIPPKNKQTNAIFAAYQYLLMQTHEKKTVSKELIITTHKIRTQNENGHTAIDKITNDAIERLCNTINAQLHNNANETLQVSFDAHTHLMAIHPWDECWPDALMLMHYIQTITNIPLTVIDKEDIKLYFSFLEIQNSENVTFEATFENFMLLQHIKMLKSEIIAFRNLSESTPKILAGLAERQEKGEFKINEINITNLWEDMNV